MPSVKCGLMLSKKNLSTNLKEFSLGLGFSLFGVADISDCQQDLLMEKTTINKFDKAVVLGIRLLDGVLEEIIDRPTLLYFHHYRQANYLLDRGAFFVASHIQDLGFCALPIPASQIIDWENQRGHLSHKKMGNLAGLGWIGRNNLLVNPQLGSRFRLVTVLTDIPVEAGQPQEKNCGACTLCIPSCPANAIAERPEDFDHRACFEKLKEFKKIGLVGQYICGVCVRACAGPKKE